MNFFIPIFTDSYSLFAYEGWRTGECPDNDPASTMWSFALDDKSLIPAKSKSTTPLSLSANVAAGGLGQADDDDDDGNDRDLSEFLASLPFVSDGIVTEVDDFDARPTIRFMKGMDLI